VIWRSWSFSIGYTDVARHRGKVLAARVVVITHQRSEVTSNAFKEVLELCRSQGVEAVVTVQEATKHSLEPGAATISEEVPSEGVDFCIAIGGDGTILRAFNLFPLMQTPVLGINYGNVGFLSAIGPRDISRSLRPFLAGEYQLIEMSLLEMQHTGKRHLAVNDVVVHKAEGGSVVQLAYRIGGVELDGFNCDGMVAATPAGSTAYNLSNGGPIVSMQLDACVLTAISPHSLCWRPLVLAPGEELSIQNGSLGAMASLYLDGRHEGDLRPGGVINVSLAREKARLVQSPDADFYRTLSEKFIRSRLEG
jgi:NAD+ kinase